MRGCEIEYNVKLTTSDLRYPLFVLHSTLRTIHIFMLMRAARAFVFWDLVIHRKNPPHTLAFSPNHPHLPATANPTPASPPPPPALRHRTCCCSLLSLLPWESMGGQLTFATADFSSRVPCAFSERLIIF